MRYWLTLKLFSTMDAVRCFHCSKPVPIPPAWWIHLMRTISCPCGGYKATSNWFRRKPVKKPAPPRPCSCGMPATLVTDGRGGFRVECPRKDCQPGPTRHSRREATEVWNDTYVEVVRGV